jgi:hypothetical protein
LPSQFVAKDPLLCLIPPPLYEQANILPFYIFYPKPTFFLGSTDFTPFYHMITPFSFLFLPKETLTVFVHPLKETFLEQKQYNDQLACSLQQSAGLNCTRDIDQPSQLPGSAEAHGLTG